MSYITDTVTSMVWHLTNPQVMIARHGDPECGNRAAYVVMNQELPKPIILCPAFFSAGWEQQIRTMIHEAAHLEGIGTATFGESYCIYFDCETSCGGHDSANSWAHFVHCLSGQKPDKPPIIQGQRSSQGQQHGSRGTS